MASPAAAGTTAAPWRRALHARGLINPPMRDAWSKPGAARAQPHPLPRRPRAGNTGKHGAQAQQRAGPQRRPDSFFAPRRRLCADLYTLCYTTAINIRRHASSRTTYTWRSKAIPLSASLARSITRLRRQRAAALHANIVPSNPVRIRYHRAVSLRQKPAVALKSAHRSTLRERMNA